MIKGKRIVVKVGTSTLTHDTGNFNLKRMEEIVRALSDIQGAGNEVILVTSAAISAGVSKLGLKERPSELRMKMAAAAVGQARLMHIYDTLFSEYGITVAQILLTGDNVEDEDKEKHLSNTFSSLLELKVIPIVNENDSVSPAEIEVGNQKVLGDNDTLSAIVARLCHADMLILMSDIDGLYDANPRLHPDARLIECIEELTPEILSMAEGEGTARGTGGMMTKLTAARIAMSAGINMHIINSDNMDNLYRLMDGKRAGTAFLAPR
ncbi:MAG: glutamate 5-kinase [Clostridia bacterium]|nr:glutamate 5-kinase [Clostridia bacterium]